MVAQKGTVRVSVAMISYNGAEFLRGQVESVLEQLGQEDELVVSDDGSKGKRMWREISQATPSWNKWEALCKAARL